MTGDPSQRLFLPLAHISLFSALSDPVQNLQRGEGRDSVLTPLKENNHDRATTYPGH